MLSFCLKETPHETKKAKRPTATATTRNEGQRDTDTQPVQNIVPHVVTLWAEMHKAVPQVDVANRQRRQECVTSFLYAAKNIPRRSGDIQIAAKTTTSLESVSSASHDHAASIMMSRVKLTCSSFWSTSSRSRATGFVFKDSYSSARIQSGYAIG